jgi:hypothetical protein
MSPEDATNIVVQRRYGCLWPRGDKMYASKKDELEIAARVL